MADPLDILYGRRPQEDDSVNSTLATLANAIASIPARRAQAAQQRAALERTQLEAYNEQLKAQEMQRKVQDLKLIDQAWQSGNRDEFIKRLPGHLQIATQKGLADLDEADAKRKKALEEARKVTDDSIARQLQFVAGTGYDPHIAQGAISELKVRYKDDPELLKQFGLVEAAIRENPTNEHVKMITDALIRKSEEQRKANEAAEKSADEHAKAQQALTGTEPIQPVEAARLKAQQEQAAATLAATEAQRKEANEIARGHLAVSRAQLGVAQAREAREAAKPTGSDKPPTGQQNRALGFFNRARQADDDLEAIEGDIDALGYLGQQRLKHAPNELQTDAGQKYHQARRAFTEARLRKDSGATIKDSEYEADEKTYFPQPADTKETLEQKRRARANVLASLAAEAGDSALRNFYGDDGPGLVDVYRRKAAKAETKKNPFR